jgi:hypothetical protein
MIKNIFRKLYILINTYLFISENKMEVQKQMSIYAKQVKKFMLHNNIHFIRNNEKFRTELNMNRRQLSYAIRYLQKNGFLKSWNDKVYKLDHN